MAIQQMAKLLESIKPPTHKGVIYVVNCNKPDVDELQFGPHENERVLTKLVDFGYKVYSIGPESLSQVMAHLKRHRNACKILIGTHTILEKNSLLCKAGTQSLILTGKAHEVPVVAFASIDKFLQNGSREKDIIGSGYLESEIQKEVDEKHTVLCTWSRIDKVPIELIDYLVTESGVESMIKEIPVPESNTPKKA